MTDSDEMCPCGRPLHYGDQALYASVQKLVDELGPEIVVTVAGAGSFRVPRHYIALHGLAGKDLPDLGFPRAL